MSVSYNQEPMPEDQKQAVAAMDPQLKAKMVELFDQTVSKFSEHNLHVHVDHRVFSIQHLGVELFQCTQIEELLSFYYGFIAYKKIHKVK